MAVADLELTFLFFVVLFCFFFSLYAKWYWSRTDDPFIVYLISQASRHRASAAPVSARRRGLDRATLLSLPVVVFNLTDFKEGLECSVCLSETLEGEEVRVLPKCNHGFHLECIDVWFRKHSTCPLCRSSVVSSHNQDPAAAHAFSDSDSDSYSDSNSDDDDNNDHVVNSREALAFPTNVLFWGTEGLVRSHGEAGNGAADASLSTSNFSSNAGVGRLRHELVIEIPRELRDGCLSSPPSTTRLIEEEEKTPIVSSLLKL